MKSYNMKELFTATATRVKKQAQSSDESKGDFHLKKEVDKLGLLFFVLIAIVVGSLSILAMISGLFHLWN